MDSNVGKSVDLYDVGTSTAVHIDWPEDGRREPVVRFRSAGRATLSLPASVVELAAAVLRDPGLLQSAEQV